MKVTLKKEELIQQRLYALLGLAFLTMLFGATAVRSETVSVGKNGDVVITGEIASIQGNGFALEHDNGLTLVDLEGLTPDEKTTLQEANLIKVGNMVTVTGEMDKGNFNKPIIKANNLTVVEKMGEAEPLPTPPAQPDTVPTSTSTP